jgi:cell division protease FtsH
MLKVALKAHHAGHQGGSALPKTHISLGGAASNVEWRRVARNESETEIRSIPRRGDKSVMAEMKIADLPKALNPEIAISVAYKKEIEEIVRNLRAGLSTLVEADKIMTPPLLSIVRDALRQEALIIPVDGNPRGDCKAQSYVQNMLCNLRRELTAPPDEKEKRRKVIALPHLDLLAPASGGMTYETRDAIAWLYENPEVLLLGFQDPSLTIPRVLENFFAARIRIIGIKKTDLPKLITQEEARKFGRDTFNPYLLYKYVSGLNAVRLRQVLREFLNDMDSDGSREVLDSRLKKLRALTTTAGFDLPSVSLDKDIGGYAETKRLLKEEILALVRQRDMAATPEEAEALERLIPRGIIFWGPPGTGKTFFAKALASELEAAIIVVSGPELKSKYVGESEANIRQVFYQARQNAPAVIVFDELDSIAMARGMYTSGSGVEHSMVNQLLTEMDGFRKEELVFVIGTTNFVDSVDPALLRPGRFELHIQIPPPNEEDRDAILQIYNRKYGLKMSDDLVKSIAADTAGYTGDHLESLCRYLKRLQLRSQKDIGPQEVQDAIRVMKERFEKALELGSLRGRE